MEISEPVPLNKSHILQGFDCGKPSLTDWLKKHAMSSQNSNHTMTKVIADKTQTVVGYYSYNVISVEHVDTTPGRIKKGLARYSIPVFLVARLAIDSRLQGSGLGKQLFLSALKLAVHINTEVPIRAVIVDALDNQAKTFYEQFELQAFPDDGLRMWLLMKDLVFNS